MVDPTISGSTASAGAGSAADVKIGERRYVDIYYDIAATSDTITVEVSTTGDFSGEEKVWTTLETGNQSTGGAWLMQNTAITYPHVRVYAGSGFSDSDVNEIQLSAK